MIKNIPITELKLGMYVTAVTKTKGHIAVKSQGWVKTKTLLNQLIKKGIIEVAIDPSKTIMLEDSDRPELSNAIDTTQIEKPPYRTTAIAIELKRATKLYDDAKSLQAKILEDITSGQVINIEPAKKLTGEIIDSIFRNQDALACLTRMREKGQYLLEHSLNVSILMSMFAKHLGLPREKIDTLALGAFLHDIGKVLVPIEILDKPGRLTAEEFEIMKDHVIHGVTTLKNTPNISQEIIEVVVQHHEKLDGNGYPYGLAGEQISRDGRMISIVDIYDALTAERVYKKGMSPNAAFKLMLGMSPNGLDGDLLQQFIKCVGIHPVGTLVKLTSGKLAIVTESNPEAPLSPVVKVFYHTKHNHYTEIKDIDLAKPYCNDDIESSVKPEDFKIDLNKFFRQALLG